MPTVSFKSICLFDNKTPYNEKNIYTNSENKIKLTALFDKWRI